MESRSKHHPAGSAVFAVLAALMVAACASPRFWPWRAAPPEPARPVQELRILSADGSTGAASAVLQYWDRNTLVLDMQGVSGSGALVLQPGEGRPWPMRLGFRVAPGRTGTLEVRGAQRVVFPVSAEGAAAIELQLAPGVYRPETERIEVQWGAGASGAYP